MPRVHHVKKARKDHPGGVKKGESYYYWTFRYGGKRYSKVYPKPSQLTSSDKLSWLYAAQENFEDNRCEDLGVMRDLCEEAASKIREVGEEYRESCDNIREHFSESSTADGCEEKADACDSLANELEYIQFDDIPEVPNKDDRSTWNGEKSFESAQEAYENIVSEVKDSIEDIGWDLGRNVQY